MGLQGDSWCWGPWGKIMHELGGVGKPHCSLWDCCGLAHNQHKGLWHLGPHEQDMGPVRAEHPHTSRLVLSHGDGLMCYMMLQLLLG